MYILMDSPLADTDSQPDLQRLFSACDLNKSGRIEYEDFAAVCRELNVRSSEVAFLFNKFDVDQDGCIDYSDFSARFHEVSETLDLAALGGAPHEPSSPWEDFEDRMGDEIGYLGRGQEQVARLYQQIHAFSDDALLQQYESLIDTLVTEHRGHSLETEQLESALRRAEEMTAQQLTELEEDLQQQLASVEKRVREEERQRLEAAVAEIQRRHESEVADLQVAVERLRKQEEFWHSSSREDIHQLKDQITEMTQENEQLRSSLVKAQMSVSILQVEMDKLKNEYADQKLQHEREKEVLRKMLAERQSYCNQIEILQTMNKKLYDSNDGLRSALVTSVGLGKKRHLSIRDESPLLSLKPGDQRMLNYSSFASEDDAMTVDSYEPTDTRYSQVASWADRYLDSGVSVSLEPGDESGSEYESDDSPNSVETVHYSYSYVQSDVEMSDLKSEGTASVAPSRRSSIASSIRRRLPAFTPKPMDTVDAEAPGPMYRLVLAGDAGAGKSSFLLRLSTNEFRGDIQTTLGVDFQMKKMLVDGEQTTLQIWDTAGQERFRSIARSYFRKAHGILLLYDVTSERSFLHVREWIDQVQDSTVDHIPMCLIGNKTDLRTEETESSCVHTAHGEKLAMAYNALFCETSAKEGTNVVEAVLHLAREVKKSTVLRRKSEPQMNVTIVDGKKALSSCCKM
ncbi:ras and EF-hand domain-containing protein isoform X2 [Lepisosteus oculatus]|uniref:ras and EF-hand domain-containing protein isoform X2 n=1 Tax=Lepisosteus oculatus TaxID=7918 RepID=UPI000740080D|nr:PREDICTED: ras and EF-hand domain-containing protein-like isoform X2 [Lepisosteus oculatus]